MRVFMTAIKTAALAAAGILLCAAAHADVTARASLTDLTYQLVDLDTIETTPYIEFLTGSISASSATTVNKMSTVYRTEVLRSAAFAPPQTSAVAVNATASTTVTLSSSGGLNIKSWASVPGPDGGVEATADSGVDLVVGPGTYGDPNFVLSPHTKLIISGSATTYVNAMSGGSDGGGYARVSMFVGRSGAGSGQSVDYAFAQAQFPKKVDTDDEYLSVSFENEGDTDLFGLMGVSTMAVAVAPVAEPLPAAMTLAGLCIIAIGNRRQLRVQQNR